MRGDTDGMEFAPAVDPRLVTFVGRTVDLACSAEVWRRMRRRAGKIGVATPCYESVRKLVIIERERRARVLAVLTTILEIATRRVPVLPEAIPRIHARHLHRSRGVFGVRKRRGPPFGGPRTR